MENDLVERQLAQEEEGIQEGVARYRRLVEESQRRGEETASTAGQRLLQAAIAPMEKALVDWREKEIKRGRPGRHNETAKVIFQLDPAVVAYITAKSVLDSVSKQNTLNNAAISVGAMIEDELRYRSFKGENKGLYQAVKRRVNKSPSYSYKRTVLNHAMGKVGLEWEGWPPTLKIRVGQKCIDMFIAATGLVKVELLNKTRNNTVYYITATAETMRWINEENARCELLSPMHFPMLVPPRDWTSPLVGGYLSPRVSRTVKLLKSRSRNYLEEMSNRDLSTVYEAVNTVQRTPWQINRRVLEIAQAIWNSNSEIGKLPPREDLPIPPCPLPEGLAKDDMSEEQLAIFREWKRRASQLYDRNIQNRSKRIQASKIIYLAERFSHESAIYFPHNLDFRGRTYAVPMFLNPQGNDLAKGLLCFAEGKPVSEPEIGDWIAIHGANLFGYDKVDYAGRVEWVEDHHKEILKCAEDPLTHRFWAEADKPWQFLAFCFEWKRFYDEGLDYISYLPIALDGSCNGLQHYSAMLRDPVGGKAVNLLPSDTPQDIYQVVADVAKRELSAKAQEGSELAMEWLKFGIDRKLCKRPVMCLPYGLTRHSCREYVEERIYEVMDDNRARFADWEPFDGRYFEATRFLADIVWESIGQVVQSARQAMDWLQKAARLAAVEGVPISWTTPTGLPVVQPYKDMKARRVHTELAGQAMMLTVLEETQGWDRKRQVNGVAPNFVHSLDSACLQMYVVRAAQHYGINSFAVVHDSYATHAADTDRSAQCLREVFIEMYQRDPLAEFREELLPVLSEANQSNLPPLPPKGNMDLEAVKGSQFFFS